MKGDGSPREISSPLLLLASAFPAGRTPLLRAQIAESPETKQTPCNTGAWNPRPTPAATTPKAPEVGAGQATISTPSS